MALACVPIVAHACEFHTASMGNYEPLDESIFTSEFSVQALPGNATVGAWKLNLTNAVGNSPNATIDALVNTISADVQGIYYDSTFVYIRHTDVPSHDLGPFPGNPAYPSNLNRTSRLPRTPVEATAKTNAGLGSIGVMVNGGLFFNAADAMSYNNQNIWHQNANVFEASSFDIGPGHPAPLMNQPGNPQPGQYHYHQAPIALLNQIDPGNTGQHHSPIVGYAWDGFPVYGPFGYDNPTDDESSIIRVESGYQIRDGLLASGIRDRTSDTGTQLPVNQRGPTVATTAAGSYLEDFEYVAGLGDLNQYNMRFTVTPEYPLGTWAYFLTLDASGESIYPYVIGTQYFGVVDTSNTGPTGGQNQIPSAASLLKVGDTNLDGTVDFTDLLAVAQNYGTDGPTQWSAGDFNRDGSVDFTDLLMTAQNYETSGVSGFDGDWTLALASVPEPSIALIVPGMLILGRRKVR